MTGPGVRRPGARRPRRFGGGAPLLAAHRDVLDVPRGSHHPFDVPRRGRAADPEVEPPVEVLGLECHLGRRHVVDLAQRPRLLEREHRASPLERRLGAQGHVHQPSRRDRARHLRRRPGRGGRAGARSNARERRGRAVEIGDDLRDVDLVLAARDRQLHRVLEPVPRPKQQLQEVIRGRSRAAPHQVEQVLGPVGQVGDACIAHRRRHALHGVHGAEQSTDRCGVGGSPLPVEQQLVAGAQVLPAFREEQLGVLRQVHVVSRARAERPRARAMAGTASRRSPSRRPGSPRRRGPAGPSRCT